MKRGLEICMQQSNIQLTLILCNIPADLQSYWNASKEGNYCGPFFYLKILSWGRGNVGSNHANHQGVSQHLGGSLSPHYPFLQFSLSFQVATDAAVFGKVSFIVYKMELWILTAVLNYQVWSIFYRLLLWVLIWLKSEIETHQINE